LGQPPEAADWSENIIRQVFETGQEVVFELTAPTPAGNKYYLSRGVPEFAADGSVTSVLIIHRNITERKQVENVLRENREFLANLFEYSGALIFVKDMQGRYEMVNRKYEEATGIQRETAIGHIDAEIFPSDIAAQYRATDLRVVESGQVVEVEDFVDSPKGRQYFFSIKFPLRAADGSIRGVCGMTTDVTERKKAEDALAISNKELHQRMTEIEKLHIALQEQAIHDPLTGLYNRRYMGEALTREYARTVRTNESLSVVMIDMDGLKKFNDTYGHDMGDQAIKTFADQLKLMTRKEDIACRYGGDEFLVILYNTDAKNASKRVEEWHKKMSNVSIPYQGRGLRITFSAGVATYPTHGESIDEIVKAADEELYRQKRVE
jgi:diguanylate cyclase (GGDEF)-like protein/PAS domain S-box-containing protein